MPPGGAGDAQFPWDLLVGGGASSEVPRVSLTRWDLPAGAMLRRGDRGAANTPTADCAGRKGACSRGDCRGVNCWFRRCGCRRADLGGGSGGDVP